MNTITLEPPSVGIQDIKVTSSALTIELSDGRSISAPLVWYPRLLNASSKERNNWELIGEGHGIHWPDLDEDLSMDGIPMRSIHPLASQRYLTADVARNILA